MRLARLAALVVLVVPVQAWAFDWFGLHSGMTADQVRAAAPAGATLRMNGDFGFIEKGGEAVATVTFCKGKVIALSRTIDAQSDWFALAEKLIKQYGTPRVTPTSDPWAKPTSNVSKGLELSWRSGRNKYALTSYPSAQPGPHKALASLSVADLGPVNACVARHAAVRDHVRKANFVRHVKHAKRPSKLRQSKLPPIGGAKLQLLPAAVQRVQAQAAARPRPPAAPPRAAAHLETATRDTAPQVDPASARGRILRFFGLVRTPVGAASVDER